MTELKDWLTARELADYAGIAYPGVWTYLKRGILPTPDTHIGNKPLWKRSSIEEWDFTWQRRGRTKA